MKKITFISVLVLSLLSAPAIADSSDSNSLTPECKNKIYQSVVDYVRKWEFRSCPDGRKLRRSFVKNIVMPDFFAHNSLSFTYESKVADKDIECNGTDGVISSGNKWAKMMGSCIIDFAACSVENGYHCSASSRVITEKNLKSIKPGETADLKQSSENDSHLKNKSTESGAESSSKKVAPKAKKL
mgnify:CR=1 FL=1